MLASILVLFGCEQGGGGLEERIRVTVPREGASISSPLEVRGEARGYWFFEASFPVELYDGNGELLVQTFASSQSDWMTEEFVPFYATIEFDTPRTATGTLVLKKDNPSGLPENDDSVSVPIRFEKQ